MGREIKLTVHGDTVHASQYLAGVRGSADTTTLEVVFDESWDGYAKQITFWDALDQNPETRILTTDLLVDLANDIRTYRTTIPGKALAVAGECMLVIEGYRGSTRLQAMPLRLVVEYAPHTEPSEPTPEQYAQLQEEIDALKTDIQKAVRASDEADRAESAAEDAEEAANKAQSYSVNPPYIGENGNWWNWDGEKYIDSGYNPVNAVLDALPNGDEVGY